MNKTARIQASFSLPEVLLEDKIERMGKNQRKMMMPKRIRAVKSSIAGVYAGQSSAMRSAGFQGTSLSAYRKVYLI